MSTTKDASTFPEVSVRWMLATDLAEAVRIGNAAGGSVWDVDTFARLLRVRTITASVTTVGEHVRCFAIVDNGKHCVNIVALAVDPWLQRHGLGSAMLTKLKRRCELAARREIFIDVDESNLSGQLFLRANGFNCQHILRNGGTHVGEDMYRFVWSVADGDSRPGAG